MYKPELEDLVVRDAHIKFFSRLRMKMRFWRKDRVPLGHEKCYADHAIRPVENLGGI